MRFDFYKYLNFFLVLTFNYVIYLLLNFNYLKRWLLSGDDLFSLTSSTSSFYSLFHNVFSSFSGQYRHITYWLFHFYKLLTPNFLLIFLIHGVLFAIIPTIIYKILSQKIDYKFRYLLILPIMFTPIFYYHVFTISSLANVLIAIITLILIYFLIRKHSLTSYQRIVLFLLVLISFAIKETFITPLFIFILLQIKQLRFNKKLNILTLLSSLLIFIAYAYLKISNYQVNLHSDYYFVFTFKNALNNLLDMGAWILNYPRGWEYGAPIRNHIMQLIVAGMSLVLISFVGIYQFIKNKLNAFIYLLIFLSSIILFIFLNNVLVFYLDIGFLLLVISVSYVFYDLYKQNKKYAWVLLIIWLGINFSNLFIIRPQWLKYSFVANANQAAQNYKKTLEANNYQQYQQICITDHHRGAWGTEDGKLANFLSSKKFTIISTKNKELPKECLRGKSLNLVNDAWDYHRI